VKVVIDEERCTGHGRCYVLSPALFTDDERGYGQVIGDGSFTEGQKADADRAVLGCPERAITIED
jgi:ferredoxin